MLKKRDKAIRNNLGQKLFAFVLAALFSWLSSAIFLAAIKLRLIGTVFGAVLLGHAFYQIILARKEEQKLNESEQLLAFLSGQIASGYTIERALLDAASALKEQIGYRSRLVFLLTKMANQLEAQIELSQALDQLSLAYACPRLSRDLAILPWLRLQGGQIDVYLRESHRQLHMEIALQREVAAENSQRMTEALLMSILPFVFGLILFRQNLAGNILPWHKWAGLIFHLLALLVLGLTLIIAAKRIEPKALAAKNKKTKNKKASKKKIFPTVYLQIMPSFYIYKINKLLRLEATAGEEDLLWQNYLEKKFYYLLAGLFLSCLLIFSRLTIFTLAVLPVFILPLLQDLAVISRASKYKQIYRLSYPPFLNVLALLMESGLTLQIALKLASKGLKDYGSSELIKKELSAAQKSIEAGIPVADAIGDLAGRCPLPEISSALRLAVRYDQQGSLELLALLSMQATSGWQIYRNGLRRQLEQRALFLFIPMGLALINVLAIAVIPAMASFQSF